MYGKAAGAGVKALQPVFRRRPQPYARNIDVAGVTWHVLISAQPADLGQNLMALRIDMSLMAAQAEAKPVTREQMGAAVHQLDTTIKAVRSIINDLRHARASQVQTGMQLRDGGLFLNIADNGVGLSADSRKKAKAFGLSGIEERIHTLGGTCSMANNPGPGMVVQVFMPILMAATQAVSAG